MVGGKHKAITRKHRRGKQAALSKGRHQLATATPDDKAGRLLEESEEGKPLFHGGALHGPAHISHRLARKVNDPFDQFAEQPDELALLLEYLAHPQVRTAEYGGLRLRCTKHPFSVGPTGSMAMATGGNRATTQAVDIAAQP